LLTLSLQLLDLNRCTVQRVGDHFRVEATLVGQVGWLKVLDVRGDDQVVAGRQGASRQCDRAARAGVLVFVDGRGEVSVEDQNRFDVGCNREFDHFQVRSLEDLECKGESRGCSVTYERTGFPAI